MKAILIDSPAKQVREVEYSGDWRQISEIIGCDYFDVVSWKEGVDVLLDDEGLLKNPEYWFALEFPEPGRIFAGSALILGSNEEGESIEPACTLEEVQDRVIFLNTDEVRRVVNRG